MLRTICLTLVLPLFISHVAQAAENRVTTRFHIGVDATVYSSTSLEGSASTTGGSSTSSTSNTHVKSDSSEVGLLGSAGVSLGLLFGDHVDLGTRFLYRSQSAKASAGGADVTVDSSGLEFDPYLGYLFGSPEDSVRFTFGVTGGLGSASTTSPSTSSSSGGGTKTSISTAGYGAYVGFRGFLVDSLSLDPTFVVMQVSGSNDSGSSPGVDMSGPTFMMNLGITLWTGSGNRETEPTHRRRAAKAKDTQATHAEPAQDAVAPVSSTHVITLGFGDERTLTIKRNRDDSLFTLLFRDPSPGNIVETCDQVTLHVPNQQDRVLQARLGTATSMSLRFPVLIARVPLSQLNRMVVAPIARGMSPEHWIVLCHHRWTISERDRRRLKMFVDSQPDTNRLEAPGSEPEPGASTDAVTPTTAPAASPDAIAPAN